MYFIFGFSVAALVTLVVLVSLVLFKVVSILSFVSKIPNIMEVEKALGEMKSSLEMIAESKRLSTLITIEAKKDLNVIPEEFEPKKEQLRNNMLEVFEKELAEAKNKVREPDTFAFVILNHSGFNEFVDYDTKRKAQNALARLLANKNYSAVRRLITLLAKNL